MSKITITDEQAARARVKTDLETIDLCGNVFDRRRLVNSRKDFFHKLGAPVNEKTEIRFVEIELLNLVDSPDEGFDDCPVATATYGLHLFHQFADLRSDDSNSDRDFTDLLLQIRTFFLDEREFTIGAWTVQTDPIVFDEFTQFGNDTFTDVKGHFKDVTLQARFYNANE